MSAVVLDERKPLRESILWQLQSSFYDKVAIRCWSEAIVPNFVTSNAFIANCYARNMLGMIRDWFLRWERGVGGARRGVGQWRCAAVWRPPCCRPECSAHYRVVRAMVGTGGAGGVGRLGGGGAVFWEVGVAVFSAPCLHLWTTPPVIAPARASCKCAARRSLAVHAACSRPSTGWWQRGTLLSGPHVVRRVGCLVLAVAGLARWLPGTNQCTSWRWGRGTPRWPSSRCTCS
jgi:hypothetical protein